MILPALLSLITLTYAADTRCTSAGGHCQTDTTHCSGTYHSGLCDGAANRRCCVSADYRCSAQGGTCQADSHACSGAYVSGLCSGASNRRCCVNPGTCSAQQKQLACQLLHSANVDAAHRHPSGVPDNAYAYNNLKDMCDGHKASRSHYTCSTCSSPGAPGGFTCLSVDLLNYLIDLKNHGNIIVNELAGACHSCSSRHYSGLAVDLHGYGPSGNDRRREYLDKCVSHGGWGQDEGNHIHCQFYDAPHPSW